MSPSLLSFLGVVLASASYAVLDLGWVSTGSEPVAGLVAVTATAPLQVLGGSIALRGGDTGAGIGALLLGSCWAVTGVASLTIPGGQSAPAVGVFFVGACCATAVPVVLGSSRLVTAVAALSGLRFGVSGVAALTGSLAWRDLSGLVSLTVAAVAWCAAVLVASGDGAVL